MRLIILLVSMAALASSQEVNRSCAVTLRAVDVRGRPVPHRVSSFKNAEGADFADHFIGLRGTVPCNIQLYTFQVTRTDVSARAQRATNIEGRVSAWHPEAWMTVVTNPNLVIVNDFAGEPSRRLPAGYLWSGHVTPVPVVGESLWIRIRSAAAVRSPSVQAEVEAEIDENGDFRVYDGFWEGPYVLYVMNNEGRLLYTAPLNIVKSLPTEPLLITLPAEPPLAIIVK